MKKIKDYFTLCVLGLAFLGIMLMCIFNKPNDFSVSEKRKLVQMPKLSVENVLSSRFMKDFEGYAKDQFPLREENRKLATFFSADILRRSDSHEIYAVNGSLAKLDYPLNESSVNYAAKRFSDIYNRYMVGKVNNIYYSIIPDKGYFLSEAKKCPHMDYEALTDIMKAKMDFAGYIDIFDTLDESCYYSTDPHWRVEKLGKTAKTLAGGMGADITDTYEIKSLDVDYVGTYAGQSAFLVKPETINYIENDTISALVVDNIEKGTQGGVYDFEKAKGRDPYEFFLSGPISLMKIENPNKTNGKKLIIFRDSFGSSIAPYLFEAYEETDLVDIRYINPEYLDKFIDFNGADVLFLYCTSVLNHSETIK